MGSEDLDTLLLLLVKKRGVFSHGCVWRYIPWAFVATPGIRSCIVDVDLRWLLVIYGHFSPKLVCWFLLPHHFISILVVHGRCILTYHSFSRQRTTPLTLMISNPQRTWILSRVVIVCTVDRVCWDLGLVRSPILGKVVATILLHYLLIIARKVGVNSRRCQVFDSGIGHTDIPGDWWRFQIVHTVVFRY